MRTILREISNGYDNMFGQSHIDELIYDNHFVGLVLINLWLAHGSYGDERMYHRHIQRNENCNPRHQPSTFTGQSTLNINVSTGDTSDHPEAFYSQALGYPLGILKYPKTLRYLLHTGSRVPVRVP